MFKFSKKKYLDIPADKREKAHKMLDEIINEPDNLSSFVMTDSLKEYIKGLKVIYNFKEV